MIIIIAIFKCYFSGEHTALFKIKNKDKKKDKHIISKSQQIKSTVHNAKSYLN